MQTVTDQIVRPAAGGWVERGQVTLAQAGEGAQNVFQMFLVPDNVLGLIVTWVLFVTSFFVVALIIKYAMENKPAAIVPPDSVEAYGELLQGRRFREAIERSRQDESAFGQMVHAALAAASKGYGAMERAIEEQGDLLGSQRVRSLEVLNVIGQVGPMVGLFGTVYGMIVAFQTIVEVGAQPDPVDLAGGISTALITTFWGLVVGIPALAAAALIRNRIEGLMVEAMIEAEALISPFAPGGAARPVAGTASGASGPVTGGGA